ncbi:MAG: hypothetical protein GEV28_01705 [Actinophytocola sp.]|uniref:hypothetical protein n=1 Tax=Actinophytocola sp. TaxID=1872138 RepID=UPI0013230D3D|nr:hypothetical protein [Actinophytocola sp.]MPZ79167.1 hypothetical protein [Actinophytocola sp.]
MRYGMFSGPRAFSDRFAGMSHKRLPVLPTGSAAVAALERGRPRRRLVVDDEPLSWRRRTARRTPRWPPHRTSAYPGCPAGAGLVAAVRLGAGRAAGVGKYASCW